MLGVFQDLQVTLPLDKTLSIHQQFRFSVCWIQGVKSSPLEVSNCWLALKGPVVFEKVLG